MFNYLSILIGLFYIALGVFVIVYRFFLVQLDEMPSYLLGGLLILYGIFRIGRAIYYIRKRMKKTFKIFIFFISLFSVISCSQNESNRPNKGEIVIAADESFRNVTEALAERYVAHYPETKLHL